MKMDNFTNTLLTNLDRELDVIAESWTTIMMEVIENDPEGEVVEWVNPSIGEAVDTLGEVFEFPPDWAKVLAPRLLEKTIPMLAEAREVQDANLREEIARAEEALANLKARLKK